MTELIHQVEQAAAGDATRIVRLIDDIKSVIQTERDPYFLIGVLLEGIVQTTLERLPQKERRDTAIAVYALMRDRIMAPQAELD